MTMRSAECAAPRTRHLVAALLGISLVLPVSPLMATVLTGVASDDGFSHRVVVDGGVGTPFFEGNGSDAVLFDNGNILFTRFDIHESGNEALTLVDGQTGAYKQIEMPDGVQAQRAINLLEVGGTVYLGDTVGRILSAPAATFEQPFAAIDPAAVSFSTVNDGSWFRFANDVRFRDMELVPQNASDAALAACRGHFLLAGRGRAACVDRDTGEPLEPIGGLGDFLFFGSGRDGNQDRTDLAFLDDGQAVFLNELGSGRDLKSLYGSEAPPLIRDSLLTEILGGGSPDRGRPNFSVNPVTGEVVFQDFDAELWLLSPDLTRAMRLATLMNTGIGFAPYKITFSPDGDTALIHDPRNGTLETVSGFLDGGFETSGFSGDTSVPAGGASILLALAWLLLRIMRIMRGLGPVA